MNYYNWLPTTRVQAMAIFGIRTPDGTVHCATRDLSSGATFPVCQGSFVEPGREGYYAPTPTAHRGSAFTFNDTDTITVITCQSCVDHTVIQGLEEEYYCSHCQDSHVPASEIPAGLPNVYPASC